ATVRLDFEMGVIYGDLPDTNRHASRYTPSQLAIAAAPQLPLFQPLTPVRCVVPAGYTGTEAPRMASHVVPLGSNQLVSVVAPASFPATLMAQARPLQPAAAPRAPA